jgi:HNH endonuclease
LRSRLVHVIPIPMSARFRPLKSRFDEKWFLDPQSGCWVWNGALSVLGYGKIYVNRKLIPAHRVAWELYMGHIPRDKVLDHKCRRKNCVNPHHLEVVTVGENTRRRNLDLQLPSVPHLRNPKRKLSVRERFDAKWKCDEMTGCWNWTAYTNPGGYGMFCKNSYPYLAHRIAYEFYIGSIPKGLFIDHLCRNRKCVNPEHMELVTNRENVNRGIVAEVHRARQAAKTHCKYGHPFNGDNLSIDKTTGQRVCRECRINRKRSYRARDKR